MAKAPSKAAAKARKAPVRTSAASEEKAALKAEALAATGAPDPITGMSMTRPDDAPSIAQVKAARKTAVEEQFAAADANGDPEAGLRRAIGIGL